MAGGAWPEEAARSRSHGGRRTAAGGGRTAAGRGRGSRCSPLYSAAEEEAAGSRGESCEVDGFRILRLDGRPAWVRGPPDRRAIEADS
jgi:hypothetical protein